MDPVLVHALALKRDENRMAKLTTVRDELHRRLETLEDELVLCEVRVNALKATKPRRVEMAAGSPTLQSVRNLCRTGGEKAPQNPVSMSPNDDTAVVCPQGT